MFFTVKPVLSGHSNIDKTKVLKTNGILNEGQKYCRLNEGQKYCRMLGAFCNTFDLH